jgi:trimethylguanosine synthase
MGINKKIKKYYIKRFFLFEEFDNGIQMDEESWYSVVAEPISLNIK